MQHKINLNGKTVLFVGLPIKGYEKIYSINKDGEILNIKTNKLKKQKRIKGYKAVILSNNKIDKTFLIHRLIAIHFLNPPNDYIQKKLEVNHINGIKHDNRIENLEWCTRNQNMQHAYDTGLNSNKGIKNAASKLTEQNVLNIRKLSDEGTSIINLMSMYSVSITTIKSIISRKAWKHI